MGRIVSLGKKASQTLTGWISRSELEGELERFLCERGQEGYSDAITTTAASLARGEAIPLRWIGSGCSAVGLVAGETATEAEVAKVIVHGNRLDGTPIGRKKVQTKREKNQQEQENNTENKGEEEEKPKKEEKASYGMVFSLPKTISLLLLHPQEEVRKAVEEAVEEAFREAIRYIEENVTTRIREQGRETRKTNGIIGTYVTHKANSCGEPHLHIHVIMSSLVQPEGINDGKYRRIDSATLFHGVFRLAETVFYRAVKEKLIEKTTLESEDFSVNKTGSLIAFEIEGLSDGINKFSGARDHVEEIIERLKLAPTGWEARLLAWNIHRKEVKQELKSEKQEDEKDKKRIIEEIEHIIDKRLAEGGSAAEEIREIWRQKAGSEIVERICRIQRREKGLHEVNRNKIPDEKTRIVQAWLSAEITEDEEDKREFLNAAMEVSNELAEMVGVWRPADFLAQIMAWTDEETARKITADAIRHLAAEGEIKLRQPEIVAKVIENGWSQETSEMRLAFSPSAKVIPKALEQRDKKIKGITSKMAEEQRQKKIEPGEMNEILRPEQFLALLKMLEGKGLITIEGPAGSGKSFILQILKAYTEEKITIISRNAKLANDLGDEIGVEAETVARFVQRKKAPDGIIIIDEASLINQKDFLEILRLAEENPKCRIIAIGDRRQLTPLDRIGTWHSIVEETSRKGAHVMLSASWRCRKWHEEHQKWRDGTLNTDEIADRIIEGDLSAAAEKAMENNATVITATNEAAAMVSEMIQQRKGIQRNLATRLRFGCACGIGDEIRIRKNDYSKGVWNGQTGTVIGIAENGDIKIKRKKGKEVILSKDFASEHVELAYAVTADSAQGITVEQSLIFLGESKWNINQLYVASSRGKKPPIVVGTNAKDRLTEYLQTPADVTIIGEECQSIEKENLQSVKKAIEGMVDDTWEPILMSFMASQIRTIETIAHEIRNERQTETNHEDQGRCKEAEKPKPQLPPRPHHGIGR